MSAKCEILAKITLSAEREGAKSCKIVSVAQLLRNREMRNVYLSWGVAEEGIAETKDTRGRQLSHTPFTLLRRVGGYMLSGVSCWVIPQTASGSRVLMV